MAENGNQRVKSPEELALEQQAAIAKLKSDIAQGQKDQFKGPDITALPGNITSDGTFIESRILARKTQAEAFAALGTMLQNSPAFAGKPSVHLILYDPAVIASLEQYLGLMVQLTLLEQQFQQVNDSAEHALHPKKSTIKAPAAEFPEIRTEGFAANLGSIAGSVAGGAALLSGVASGPLMVGYAGAAVLRTAIDIASLFRVNTGYKNFDLTIDDTALAAELKKVLPANWKLWNPAAFPANMVDASADAVSAFLNAYHRVLGQNKRAAELAGELDARIRQANEAAGTEADVDKKEELHREAAFFVGFLEPMTLLEVGFAQLQNVLNGIDPNTKTTPLTQVLQAGRLAAVVRKGYIIRLAVVSKGSNKVSQRLWSSAVIRHSAGTELSCVVFAPDGEIVFADTQLKYTPYIKAEDIRV